MTYPLPGMRGVRAPSAKGVVVNCPACGAINPRAFFQLPGVPVDSCRLVANREEAKSFPRGDLHLALCEHCGFIWNMAFDPSVQNYSAVFEETQWFSPRFRAFGSALVKHLIETYDLRGKDVLEIGCGPGHFLSLLCENGGNRGIGLDPHYREENTPGRLKQHQVRIIGEYFSEQHAPLIGDLIVCRHTLEHIQPVGELLRLVHRSIGERSGTVLFFEVPDMLTILQGVAFWQLYYEHCSYLTAGSLARLFRATGFEVFDVRQALEGQVVLIEGRRASHGANDAPCEAEETVEEVCSAVDRFVDTLEGRLSFWRKTFGQSGRFQQRIVLWGGASQSVAFTLALGVEDQIEYIVNINPHQHGKYAVGTGQQIIAPEFLREYRPDLVVVMNPLYREEISRSLDRLGVHAELVTASGSQVSGPVCIT